jgi:hypothetical protein
MSSKLTLKRPWAKRADLGGEDERLGAAGAAAEAEELVGDGQGGGVFGCVARTRRTA